MRVQLAAVKEKLEKVLLDYIRICKLTDITEFRKRCDNGSFSWQESRILETGSIEYLNYSAKLFLVFLL
jgi:hypothetical protein